jgi:hypothetical protein
MNSEVHLAVSHFLSKDIGAARKHFAGAHYIMALAAKAIKQPTYHKFQSCHFWC